MTTRGLMSFSFPRRAGEARQVNEKETEGREAAPLSTLRSTRRSA